VKFSKRGFYIAWLLVIGCFAVLHALHLSADFPNHTPWFCDWAKYTDEGWYGSAAVRWHLTHHWYMRGDFNPAPAVPIWPLLEWVLFFFTGVTIEAARGLAVGFFFLNLLLSYFLLRRSSSRWTALFAVTMLTTSPFLYCFSRLAILEPLLIALTLIVLLIALHLPRSNHPINWAICIGILLTLMLLTKTTTVFLLPAILWTMVQPLWAERRKALRLSLISFASFVLSFALWMCFVVSQHVMADYRRFFFINKYIKPPEFYWPLVSLWWSLHGGLWVDRVLFPLAAVLILVALIFCRRPWAQQWLRNPLMGASVLAVAGYILFMTVQNHPQPRYFAVVAFFCFFLVAQGLEAVLCAPGKMRFLGYAAVAIAALAAGLNGAQTVHYVTHLEYTFINAATNLTRYIDEHPNGNRLLDSISGDQISLMTHLPSICDDFGTLDLATKLNRYKPGWYATWNDFDPGTLEDIHTHFMLEEVAAFPAFDDPDRNELILYKLHPLPRRIGRDPSMQNLQIPMAGDKILIPVE